MFSQKPNSRNSRLSSWKLNRENLRENIKRVKLEDSSIKLPLNNPLPELLLPIRSNLQTDTSNNLLPCAKL